MEAHEKHQILFSTLVLMLHQATMQQLGKMKNPLTDKIERDLGAARNTIDMLEMLEVKTKGNLDDEENRLISTLLRELRLNYVDEAKKPAPPTEQEQQGKAPE